MKNSYMIDIYDSKTMIKIGCKYKEQAEELSHFRFKKIIAELLDCREREQWRLCADVDQDLIQKVLKKHNNFTKSNPNIKL